MNSAPELSIRMSSVPEHGNTPGGASAAPTGRGTAETPFFLSFFQSLAFEKNLYPHTRPITLTGVM
jgi:hypothetical protein